MAAAVSQPEPRGCEPHPLTCSCASVVETRTHGPLNLCDRPEPGSVMWNFEKRPTQPHAPTSFCMAWPFIHAKSPRYYGHIRARNRGIVEQLRPGRNAITLLPCRNVLPRINATNRQGRSVRSPAGTGRASPAAGATQGCHVGGWSIGALQPSVERPYRLRQNPPGQPMRFQSGRL